MGFFKNVIGHTSRQGKKDIAKLVEDVAQAKAQKTRGSTLADLEKKLKEARRLHRYDGLTKFRDRTILAAPIAVGTAIYRDNKMNSAG